MAAKKPVAIIMGSQSDWEIMRFAAAALVWLSLPETVERRKPA